MPREQSYLKLSKTQRREEEKEKKNEEAVGRKHAKNLVGRMNFF